MSKSLKEKAIQAAHIKMDIHRTFPSWTEQEIDRYMKADWPELMKELEKKYIKVSLRKGGEK